MEPVIADQPLSFAARMDAEEQRYAELMAQAKNSLARIKEIGDGFGKARENSHVREDDQIARTKDLLSRIEAGAESGMAEEEEDMKLDRVGDEEDHTMEGIEHANGDNHTAEEDHRMDGIVEMDISTGDNTGSRKLEDSDFPQLMERAKKLLAQISMNEVSASAKVPEPPVAKEMWTEAESDAFWNSM